MMHLHGFYYRVEARGDAAHDSALARAHQATVVSVATRPGEWMSVAWSPDRPGNWLFHCHFVAHMSADQRLDRMPGARVAAASHEHAARRSSPAMAHATESMAGLLLGITVRPANASGADRTVVASASSPDRAIDLFANARPRTFGERSALGFIVQEGPRPPAADSVRIPGTPLLLTRGQTARITVHNRLTIPLAVHWHGIELESYSDGVGGWSGSGRRVAPMIAPGASFVATMTPPRAGTFMYHVHSEHGDELSSGLYAPLLVLEPGTTFDPETDRVFVIATGGPGAGRAEDEPPFVNGTAAPDTLRLTVGTTYRLRLIDISSNEAHTVSLRGANGLATWRTLARDGRDLPREQATSQPARENTASGVTRDFEFTPAATGDYALSVATIVASKLTGHVTTVPIRVRAP
jgi:FtsP/CotA-like multicopper oxidase with cupredoxin domain